MIDREATVAAGGEGVSTVPPSPTPPEPPSLGQRRYVVASRYPYAMVAFGQPTTLERARDEAGREYNHDGRRKVGVFELRLVKP